MDAPENARIIERIERCRLAVMYPACLRGPVTAGLDGIRLSEGRRIDAQSIYRAFCSDNTSGWIYPGYLFSPSRPLHPRNAFHVPLVDTYRLPENWIEVLLISHHRPDSPGCFIGHGHQDDIGRPSHQ